MSSEFDPTLEEQELGISDYIRLLGRRRCEEIAAKAINDAFTEALENIKMRDPTDEEIEKELQEKGLNAPRLNPEHIESRIIGETYTILPSGRTMICELTLINGFTVRGESSVVSKANFNEEMGRKLSRVDARRKIWQLEAYLLMQRLYDEGPE